MNKAISPIILFFLSIKPLTGGKLVNDGTGSSNNPIHCNLPAKIFPHFSSFSYSGFPENAYRPACRRKGAARPSLAHFSLF
ncbi:hypothetical protein [Ottowia cancrivicina]|uniref:hypothetical protein n=1 Tax=Ottowia cancrivicina TaxID=3040346 RepID=UPI00244365D0|nr:hypothetical protein [Ottowia sp. 10c7w1]